MNRLVTMFVMAAAALVLAVPAQAQSKEFSGSWAIDADKSAGKDGPKMVIFAFTEKEFTVKFGASDKATAMPFKLDGSESEVRGAKTKAVWKNNKLQCTVTNGAPKAPEAITFSRDGAWLVLEASDPEHGPMKFFFKKAQ